MTNCTLKISNDIETKIEKVDIQYTNVDYEVTASELEAHVDQELLGSINDFGFNIFEFSNKVGRENVLPCIGMGILQVNGLKEKVDFEKFVVFTQQVQSRYQSQVSYHNDLHGSDTAQHVSYMLKAQNFSQICQFNDVDKLSLLVAALGHDINHNGFSNGFHKASNSNLHQMFGDSSIQEYFHAAQTIKLLERPELDFITSSFTKAEVRLIKKRITTLILNTDMSHSKALKEELQNRLDKYAIKNGRNIDKLIDQTSVDTIEASKQLVSSTILHAADISTSIRNFDVSEIWANKLFDEFFAQGDHERSQGMEVSFLCDRSTTKIAAEQAGFIQFCVFPIFQQLDDISYGQIKDVQLKSAEQNMVLFKLKAKKEKEDAASIKFKQYEFPRSAL